MASRLLAYVGALLVVSLSSACSGSSGDPPPPQGLAKGSFVKDAYTLTLGGWGGHFADFVPYVRIQQLYSGTSGVAANAIGASGFITAVEFFSSDTAASYTCPSIALKMGHTSLDALGTTFATNVEQGKGTLATVRTAKPFTVPAVTPGAGVKLTLDAPFYFNGFDNVVVEFIRDGACASSIDLNYDNTVASSALWSTTNGGATGSSDVAPNLRFHFEGGANVVLAGDRISTNGYWVVGGDVGRTQALILASDVAGRGPITGIAFQPDAVTAGATVTVSKVTLAHMPLSVTDLAADFAVNVGSTSGSVTVAENVTFTVAPSQATPVWIPFNKGSFAYDGTRNILVDVTTTAMSAPYVVDYWNVPNYRILESATPAAATGTRRLRSLQPTLRFHGGTIDAGTLAGALACEHVLDDGDGAAIQSLYLASELGTRGRITAVNVRLNANSAAATHATYRLAIGHTAKTALAVADTFASNMDENQTAYSGSLTIPAGLKAGDWVRIPLSSPFSYTAEENLAILFSTGGGTAPNFVDWSQDVTRYAGRMVGTDTGGATSPAWFVHGVHDIRLEISK